MMTAQKQEHLCLLGFFDAGEITDFWDISPNLLLQSQFILPKHWRITVERIKTLWQFNHMLLAGA